MSELHPPPQTDYFHLFICVAIVAIYGDDVIEQQLATDQMLLHFGNLAMHMNGELVLRKVRLPQTWAPPPEPHSHHGPPARALPPPVALGAPCQGLAVSTCLGLAVSPRLSPHFPGVPALTQEPPLLAEEGTDSPGLTDRTGTTQS